MYSSKSPPSTSSSTKSETDIKISEWAILLLGELTDIVVPLIKNLFEFADIRMLEFLHNADLSCKRGAPCDVMVIPVSVDHFYGKPFASCP